MRPCSLLLLALAGCSYTSAYTPPMDGRPRVVWKDGDVAADFAGGGLRPTCAEALAAAIEAGELTVHGTRTRGAAELRDRLLIHSVSVRPPPPEHPGYLGVHLAYVGTSRSSSGGSSGKAAEALAVALVLVLAPIDIYLALAPAESAGHASEVIDLVNGYNAAIALGLEACTGEPRRPRREPPPEAARPDVSPSRPGEVPEVGSSTVTPSGAIDHTAEGTW